ncbi:MAG: PAS domain-containing protein, partial [Proteobacteria bacterium]|nr:PAS domain-containing protein [Pseudomonadota bacterium]
MPQQTSSPHHPPPSPPPAFTTQETFAAIAAHLPGTVFRSQASAPWDVVFMGGAHEVSTGRSVQDFLADGTLYPTLVHPDDQAHFTQAFAQALQARQAWVEEYRVQHCDGSWHWARLHASGVYADD